MSLTYADWNKFLWRQQNEVEYWIRLIEEEKRGNESLQTFYTQALKKETKLLEKIREELSKCKQ